MKSNTEKLLVVMKVLSWIVFIGLIIKAGSFLVSYLVSLRNAIAAKDLYKGTDLSAYREYGMVTYSFVVGYQVILLIVQSYIAYLLTMLLSNLNILKPFSVDVFKLMQRISYAILGVWLVALVNNIHVGFLEKRYGIPAIYFSLDSIFLAGIAFVLAQMFKRGIEIQSENELTV